MTQITAPTNCGNAPKQLFIKDFLSFTAQGEIENALQMLTEDVELDIPGHATRQGKAAVAQLLREDAAREKVAALIISNLLSHGTKCAADGVLQFAGGSEVRFCGIYQFSSNSKNAKIKQITTYSIVTKSTA